MVRNNFPDLGLGTWQNKDQNECVNAVKTALETGYRHIDTAQVYGNESYVGEGIEKSSVSRRNVYLATKVWIDNLSYDNVFTSTEESLNKLKTSYLDLLYVHWPGGDYKPEKTLSAFKELKEDNKINHIGVSNFSIQMVREAQDITNKGIFANQVEMHPLLQQEEMVKFCQKEDILLVAYSPLVRGKVLEIEEINEIAEKHGVSEAQVTLAWLQSIENVVPIPKSSSEAHIKENFRSKKLELDNDDIYKIENISDEERLLNPGYGIKW